MDSVTLQQCQKVHFMGTIDSSMSIDLPLITGCCVHLTLSYNTKVTFNINKWVYSPKAVIRTSEIDFQALCTLLMASSYDFFLVHWRLLNVWARWGRMLGSPSTLGVWLPPTPVRHWTLWSGLALLCWLALSINKICNNLPSDLAKNSWGGDFRSLGESPKSAWIKPRSCSVFEKKSILTTE